MRLQREPWRTPKAEAFRKQPACDHHAMRNVSSVVDSTRDVSKPDPERVQKRADNLTPEEHEVGSDDPIAQAQAILADSDARTDDHVSPPGKPVEHRHSEDTVEPPDRPRAFVAKPSLLLG